MGKLRLGGGIFSGPWPHSQDMAELGWQLGLQRPPDHWALGLPRKAPGSGFRAEPLEGLRRQVERETPTAGWAQPLSPTPASHTRRRGGARSWQHQLLPPPPLSLPICSPMGSGWVVGPCLDCPLLPQWSCPLTLLFSWAWGLSGGMVQWARQAQIPTP